MVIYMAQMSIFMFLTNQKAYIYLMVKPRKQGTSKLYILWNVISGCLPKPGYQDWSIIGYSCMNDVVPWNAFALSFCLFLGTFFLSENKNYKHRTTFKVPRNEVSKFWKRHDVFADITSAFYCTAQTSSLCYLFICLYFPSVENTPPLLSCS